MNFAEVARLLAGFAAFFTLAQLPPLCFALLEAPAAKWSPVAGFAASLGVGALVAGLLHLAGRTATRQVFRREAIAVAALSWLLASLLGALPFQWSGLLTDPVDAVFETVSGLTTTGASVLSSGANPAVEDCPRSLLLWRAMLQWLGGIGVVLVFVALLPAMGVVGKNLVQSEAVGVGTERFQPRAIEKARWIAGIYVGLTALCTLLLVALGGFGWFDAVCHAFTALATGGYSTRTSVRLFDSLGGELVLVVFMFLGGCSFAVLATNVRDGLAGIRDLLRSGEFRIYALVTLAVVGAVAVSLVRAGLPLGDALRQATFNGVSVLTSTGYATADFQVWPPLALGVLFLAMFVGGCSGSTAGGLKQVRLLVTLKLLAYSLRHFVKPKIVERIKLDNEPLPAETISTILAIVLMWVVGIGLGALVIALDDRLTFAACFTMSASMMGSCGPAMTVVDPATAADALLHGSAAATLAGTPNVGPFGGYAELHGWTKLVLCAQMLLGRLEMMTLVALFMPSFWRR